MDDEPLSKKETRLRCLELVHDFVDANTSAKSVVTRARQYADFVEGKGDAEVIPHPALHIVKDGAKHGPSR